MDTKFDKTDYIILILVYGISAILNVFDYLDQDAKLIEYLIDIPTYIIASYIAILFFIRYIIPKFLINQKKYFLFALLGLITVCLVGNIERTVGFLTGGNDWSKFPSLYSMLLYGTFDGADSVAMPLAILVTKKVL